MRASRIESLENALKQMEQVEESDPAKKCLQNQLREARAAQRSSKPPPQQRTNAAFRPQSAQKKLEKARAAVVAQHELITKAQAALAEM
eukprot:6371954-Pyramimonas_sp.AAC.1